MRHELADFIEHLKSTFVRVLEGSSILRTEGATPSPGSEEGQEGWCLR